MRLPEEGILMLEKNILFLLPIQETPIILFASFYVFNMHYTEICFHFLSLIFWKKKKNVVKNTSI